MPADAPGFISSIINALARHADAQVESLEISLVLRGPSSSTSPASARMTWIGSEHPHGALIKVDHVRVWLR
jgi:hypothetical protein